MSTPLVDFGSFQKIDAVSIFVSIFLDAAIWLRTSAKLVSIFVCLFFRVYFPRVYFLRVYFQGFACLFHIFACLFPVSIFQSRLFFITFYIVSMAGPLFFNLFADIAQIPWTQPPVSAGPQYFSTSLWLPTHISQCPLRPLTPKSVSIFSTLYEAHNNQGSGGGRGVGASSLSPSASATQVAILAKVLWYQNFHKTSGQEQNIRDEARDFARNFDAVLDVTVKLAGDTIFEHDLPGQMTCYTFLSWILWL